MHFVCVITIHGAYLRDVDQAEINLRQHSKVEYYRRLRYFMK